VDSSDGLFEAAVFIMLSVYLLLEIVPIMKIQAAHGGGGGGGM
jgi:hypothetical protein